MNDYTEPLYIGEPSANISRRVKVYAALNGASLTKSEIAYQTGLGTTDVLTALRQLESMGRVSYRYMATDNGGYQGIYEAAN